MRPEQLARPLDEMAEAVNGLIATAEPLPTRPVFAMRRHLFEILNFVGNEENYYDPDNLYLNRVLKRKRGLPIALSCVYLFVAWRLKLLVHGIALPGHFLVGHRVPRGVVILDPFNGGKLLRTKDCEVRVRRLGLPFKHAYLDPATNVQILSRMIVNLINIYTDRGQTARAQAMARLFQLLK